MFTSTQLPNTSKKQYDFLQLPDWWLNTERAQKLLLLQSQQQTANSIAYSKPVILLCVVLESMLFLQKELFKNAIIFTGDGGFHRPFIYTSLFSMCTFNVDNEGCRLVICADLKIILKLKYVLHTLCVHLQFTCKQYCMIITSTRDPLLLLGMKSHNYFSSCFCLV